MKDGAQVKLTQVPFFRQELYYCGPASLAMVLAWNNLDISPENLVDQVYTPGREGTFPQDLVAAARREGRLAVEISDLDSLLRELKGGHPVIVMQNLAVEWFPQWHFAVAIGYNLSERQIILRSGTTRRLVTPLNAFERTWRRAEHWALLVLPPSEAPSAAEESSWLSGIAGLERAGHLENALVAYRTFLGQYPDNVIAKVGEANTLFGLEDYQSAESAYREALASDPNLSEAWNNLAYALHLQGKTAAAIDAARRAISLSSENNKVYLDTLREISNAAP